jgi:hypothetical protein
MGTIDPGRFPQLGVNQFLEFYEAHEYGVERLRWLAGAVRI